VELNGALLLTPEGLTERRAALKTSSVKAASICGGQANELVHPDKARRQNCAEALKKLVTIAGELGATGPITVPIFNRNDRVPDLSPYKSRPQLEKELLIAMLGDLARVGEKAGACVILEPLNRYESNALANLAAGAEIVRAIGSPGVRLMGDFFHMHIEEPNIPAAFTGVKDVLAHIHLADNTRKEPGSGDIDYKSAFAALNKIGYKGYMAMECGLSGPAAQALPASVKYLRKCMGK
jgi:sugar phosphate isomerase/epimerase